jgi:integrase
MGWIETRTGRDGKPRYIAKYRDLCGRKKSAGTFASKREANGAWQRAEVQVAEGQLTDPRRGRQTFRRYVEERWLPHHVMEPTTREKYTYYLNAYILPEFGPMRMMDILPEHVRAWITKMQAKGASAWTIQYGKYAILNSIFTTAMQEDRVITFHPSRGVRTPTVPSRPRQIITPEQFDAIYQALPSADMQLLVEAAVESGLRWGELTELRVGDLSPVTRILTVSRKVIEVNPKFEPNGKRFAVKDYPKDKEYRRLKLSAQLVRKIEAHVRSVGLEPGDLLFAHRAGPIAARPLRVVPDPAALGLTKPNEKGRRYRHGTLSAYTAGRCRCEHCRGAFAAYRAKRRAEAGARPRPRAAESDGHIPRNWFRRSVWLPACQAAKLGFSPRVHDLRHAHASWLLAGGADLQVVKERLGHASIMTTQKYLTRCPTLTTRRSTPSRRSAAAARGGWLNLSTSQPGCLSHAWQRRPGRRARGWRRSWRGSACSSTGRSGAAGVRTG